MTVVIDWLNIMFMGTFLQQQEILQYSNFVTKFEFLIPETIEKIGLPVEIKCISVFDQLYFSLS